MRKIAAAVAATAMLISLGTTPPTTHGGPLRDTASATAQA